MREIGNGITRRGFIAGSGLLALAQPSSSIDSFFAEIVAGFVKNARATSPSFAVCDYPGGTKLKNCLARSGKTYIGVARMMPPLASIRAGGGRVAGVDLD